jgi:hypothetical protein
VLSRHAGSGRGIPPLAGVEDRAMVGLRERRVQIEVQPSCAEG